MFLYNLKISNYRKSFKFSSIENEKKGFKHPHTLHKQKEKHSGDYKSLQIKKKNPQNCSQKRKHCEDAEKDLRA